MCGHNRSRLFLHRLVPLGGMNGRLFGNILRMIDSIRLLRHGGESIILLQCR